MSIEEIEEWLNTHRWDKKYFEQPINEATRTNELWLQKVHGAKILEDIFSQFSEARVSYDKIIYGVALTEWLIENALDDLREIADLLSNLKVDHPTHI